ncbi:MAG TPA: ATP-binding protein [Acidimicrobiales bacterium]|nr:ATP-binding protein [Acidimicrobiales bacterium]
MERKQEENGDDDEQKGPETVSLSADEAWAGGRLAPFGVRLPLHGDHVELSYSVLETAPVGMALVDAGGAVWWVNPALCRLLDRSRDDVLALHMADVVHQDDLAAYEAMTAEVAAGGLPSVTEARWLRPDGGEVRVSLSASLASDPGGRPLLLGGEAAGVVVIQAVDVSGQRAAEQAAARAQEELERRNVALERSNQELAEFAYVVSHDLSEPLRVIAGHVQLLAQKYKGQLDEEADEWIAFAVDGAARLRALIDSLLAYSRVGRDEHPMSELDTNAVVHAAVAGLHVAVDSASAIIDVDTLPVVHGDPSELGRVFANLIANAIKFRAAGVLPVVRVHAERGDGEWRFVVSDNGVGIAPQHRERVFRLFQRLHRREQYEGTGMGLSICRKIVERGGGRIWVEDGPDGGAAFCFTVPDRQGVE